MLWNRTHVVSVGLLSRNTNSELSTFREFKGLEELNIHGCVTDEGVELLKSQLYPTLINDSTLSTIARPGFTYFNRH